MNDATLTQVGEGSWSLSGALNFSTVPRLWQALRPLLAAGGKLQLSLGGVSRANSAGLVLLLEARDVASAANCHLQLSEVPEELLALARMSQCEPLLDAS